MKPEVKKMVKCYFKYHIPMLVVAIVCFMASYFIGVRTPLGKAILIAGCIVFLAMPPVSLILTKRKFEKILKRGGEVE